MFYLLKILVLVASSLCVAAGPVNQTYIEVDCIAPSGAGVPLDGFVSYSIEFSSFPDFAGIKLSISLGSEC